MRQRFSALALALALLCACFLPSCGQETAEEARPVIYIPLDNRPINDLQVRLLARSLGMELLMPEESLYASAINGAVTAAGLQYGDRAALLAWLMEHEKDADVIVLYLDQLLSGGLMNSRCMEGSNTVTLPDGRSFSEYDIIDYVASLAETHTLYVIDSQFRLATSNDYLDFTMDDYTISRAYGQLERPALKENASIEDVIALYTVLADGSDPAAAAELTEEQAAYFFSGEPSPLSRYLAIRERKLRLNAYALQTLYTLPQVRYFFGVDDSAAGNNIQSLEYTYLNRLAGGTLEKLSAIDCLGELAISCLSNERCGSESVSVSVRYYGSKDNALNYAGHTVSEAVEQTLRLCGGTKTDSDAEVDILVACDAGSEEASLQAGQALIAQLKENTAKEQPTIYLDFAGAVNPTLPCDAEITLLLSAGLHANGSGASAIMGISQGLARYRALQSGELLGESCHEAFLQELLLMFAKGYYWKSQSKWEMEQGLNEMGLSGTNLTMADEEQLTQIGQMLTEKINASSAAILASFKGGKYITSLSPYKTKSVRAAAIENCRYPWLRNFEFTADLTVRLW